MAFVFLTGASGFLGRQLGTELIRRGHRVRALVRPGSEPHIASGCEVVTADPLSAQSFSKHAAGCDTLVHLVGVTHPSPAKAAQFRTIDLASAKASIAVASENRIRHFVYVSVAHPAPVMREYIAARTEAEQAIRASGLPATILRPWYVLGPGRRWPILLLPVYRILEALPRTRESARRLGLVTDAQMIAALANAVENPPNGVRILEVPQIRAGKI